METPKGGDKWLSFITESFTHLIRSKTNQIPSLKFSHKLVIESFTQMICSYRNETQLCVAWRFWDWESGGFPLTMGGVFHV